MKRRRTDFKFGKTYLDGDIEWSRDHLREILLKTEIMTEEDVEEVINKKDRIDNIILQLEDESNREEVLLEELFLERETCNHNLVILDKFCEICFVCSSERDFEDDEYTWNY